MTELVEVYRNSVNSWEADMMGHLNVQHYVAKAVEGLAVLGQVLGLAPADLRARDARLLPVEQHIRFLREQRPGAPIRILAGVLETGPERLRVYQEMRNTLSDDVAATFVSEVTLQQRGTREWMPLPRAVMAAADAHRIELPDHGAPRGLRMDPPRDAPTLADAEANGMVPTYTGLVRPEMCADDGRMATRAYMGVISDSVPNLLAQTRGEDRSRSGIGGAALEYRFVYRQAPRQDDVIALRTGIKDIASKAYTFCHWMFDRSSGEAVATAEAVAVALDMEARKAIAIPDGMRTGLEKVVVPGLSV
ncbi:hypothetical protein H0Z60_01830 [Ectothiorhodospiraceae bacterium WFHF3C12]|nr:hypothetical protein [Ectothiorhodospiraceae bacterium WFHF3C12]